MPVTVIWWSGLRRDAHDAVLVARGEVEEHRDHDERDGGVEDLDRQVVARLRRQVGRAALAPERDGRPQDQPPGDGADGERGDPRALPEREDALRLVGDVADRHREGRQVLESATARWQQQSRPCDGHRARRALRPATSPSRGCRHVLRSSTGRTGTRMAVVRAEPYSRRPAQRTRSTLRRVLLPALGSRRPCVPEATPEAAGAPPRQPARYSRPADLDGAERRPGGRSPTARRAAAGPVAVSHGQHLDQRDEGHLRRVPLAVEHRLPANSPPIETPYRPPASRSLRRAGPGLDAVRPAELVQVGGRPPRSSVRIQPPGRRGSAQPRTTSSKAVSTRISKRRQDCRSDRLTRSAVERQHPARVRRPPADRCRGARPASGRARAVGREQGARLEVARRPRRAPRPRAPRRRAERVARRRRLDRAVARTRAPALRAGGQRRCGAIVGRGVRAVGVGEALEERAPGPSRTPACRRSR